MAQQRLERHNAAALPTVGLRAELRRMLEPVNAKTCGQESLYIFLIMHHCKCSFDDVRLRVPVGAMGSSLADLRAAARDLGLTVEAVKCPSAQLSRLPLPAIAHLEPSALAPLQHFVILTSVKPSVVTIIDPTKNCVVKVSRQEFTRISTGYFLVRADDEWSAASQYMWWLAGAVCLLAWLFTSRRLAVLRAARGWFCWRWLVRECASPNLAEATHGASDGSKGNDDGSPELAGASWR